MSHLNWSPIGDDFENKQTLAYYDKPLIFACERKSAPGVLYLAMNTDEEFLGIGDDRNYMEYTLVPATKETIEKIASEEILEKHVLRQIGADAAPCLIVRIDGSGIRVREVSLSEIKEEDLPPWEARNGAQSKTAE